MDIHLYVITQLRHFERKTIILSQSNCSAALLGWERTRRILIKICYIMRTDKQYMTQLFT